MSRYVDKPHGITIGSANQFSFMDEDDNYQHFNAVLWFRQYTFDQPSTIHVGIKPPAIQMVFYRTVLEEPETFEGKTWVNKKNMYRLKDGWVRWLDTNCPGWGYPPMKNADRIPNLFFKRRADALLLASEVDKQLKGIKIMP